MSVENKSSEKLQLVITEQIDTKELQVLRHVATKLGMTVEQYVLSRATMSLTADLDDIYGTDSANYKHYAKILGIRNPRK